MVVLMILTPSLRFQCRENRTVRERCTCRAVGGKDLERSPHPLEFANLGIHDHDLVARLPLDPGAGSGGVRPQLEQVRDLRQREAEILRPLDEPDASRRASRIPPVPDVVGLLLVPAASGGSCGLQGFLRGGRITGESASSPRQPRTWQASDQSVCTS